MTDDYSIRGGALMLIYPVDLLFFFPLASLASNLLRSVRLTSSFPGFFFRLLCKSPSH